MKIAVGPFRGEAPRIDPALLPPEAAQEAINARLVDGTLDAWRQFQQHDSLGFAPMSIYKLNGSWLAFATDVDVARGLIPGDDTFRVYLTGPDQYSGPRWTNYELAFASPGGVGPVTTRPVGVPNPDEAPSLEVGVDPSPTTFSVNETDDNASLATAWTLSPQRGGSTAQLVEQVYNAYKVTYDENRNPGEDPYAYRNFGVADASLIVASTNFLMSNDPAFGQAFMMVGADDLGGGVGILYQNGVLQIRKCVAWSGQWGAAVLASVAMASLSQNVTYTLRGTVQVNEDGTRTVTAKVLNDVGDTELATVTATNTFASGDNCAFGNGAATDLNPAETYYSNFTVQASGALDVTTINTATSYVYTFVNDIGEQSGPSAPSPSVLRPAGVAITVTTPTGLPTGVDPEYGIVAKRIYRAVTGATGSIFRFVAEIDIGTASYIDALTDDELGEALESEDWELPPADLKGILALPNGIMVGFRRNQLCFSAQNRPHAWPVAYRLNTDTDIVAIGNIDNIVVVATEAFPYLAQGSSPDSYTMQKCESPRACVSKRSMSYLTGIGVVFASTDGWVAVAGLQPRLLTEGVFDEHTWLALNPQSIIAVAHDEVLHFFCEPAVGQPRGYALDMKPSGFGLMQLAYHASAVHAEIKTDRLYLVLDQFDAPSSAYLPQNETGPVAPDAQTIFLFEGDEANRMTYRWRGKLNLLPYPWVPLRCRVRADDYDNLIVRGYGDGALHFEHVGVNARTFALPKNVDPFDEYELEVIGTSKVRSIQVGPREEIT